MSAKVYMLSFMYEENEKPAISETFGMDKERDLNLADALIDKLMAAPDKTSISATIMDYLEEMDQGERGPFVMTAFCAYYARVVSDKIMAKVMKDSIRKMLEGLDGPSLP